MKKQKGLSIPNKKAKFNYEFIETYDAGIILVGTEIKSIREGKVSFSDSFCYIHDEEVFLKNLHISEYDLGNINNHDPLRVRKLLLNKDEILKLKKKSEEKGLTIVPVKIYINDRNLAKVIIALAKGKKQHDKRNTIKEREIERNLKRDFNI
jgi:SsrA-binding protein